MMDFYTLKRMAKDKLHGSYLYAVLGMLICYIPVYLISTAEQVAMLTNGTLGFLIAFAVGILAEIFIIDIFTVGYMRSLIELNDKPEGEGNRYDINTVMSGFTKNYKNTVKIMFTKKLYTFGWGVLAVLPYLLVTGVMAFILSMPQASGLLRSIMNIIQSPTETMVMNVAEYLTENYPFMPFMMLGASVASVVLSVVYLRKIYLYEMIPMIAAQNPDITSAEAFAKTKEIMLGNRLRYFMLQLSFIGILLLTSVIISISGGGLLMYVAMAIAMPYMNMTFVQFYLMRTRVNVIEINAEISADNTERND